LLSLQAKVPLPRHAPLPLQVSVGVHKLPSVQLAPLSVALPTLLQAPVVVLQLSNVHGLPSLQFLLLPYEHEPPTQTSARVQLLPSLQVLVSSVVKTQPLPALHVSSVHGRLSLQVRLPEPTQTPLLLQVSVGVHKLPSVQLAPFKDALPGLLQLPLLTLQLSSVHGLLSLQSLLLSITYTQPPVAVQLSSVQTLLSLQVRLPEPTQAPLLSQASVGVHRLPSLHKTPDRLALPTLLQAPLTGSQASKVHGLPSSQATVPV
jgi:hypothetical protein